MVEKSESCKHKWLWIINLTIENSLFWINSCLWDKICRINYYFFLTNVQVLPAGFQACFFRAKGISVWSFPIFSQITLNIVEVHPRLSEVGISSQSKITITSDRNWNVKELLVLKKRIFVSMFCHAVALGPFALICWVSQGLGPN